MVITTIGASGKKISRKPPLDTRGTQRYYDRLKEKYKEEDHKKFEQRQQISKKSFMPLWAQAALVGTISFCTAYSLVSPFSQDRNENIHVFGKNMLAGVMSVMGVGAFDAALRLYQERNNTK